MEVIIVPLKELKELKKEISIISNGIIYYYISIWGYVSFRFVSNDKINQKIKVSYFNVQ